MLKVITIGLGYIGLPTSALIASKNLHVFGVDVNEKVVDTINKGEIHIVEPELDLIVKRTVENGYLKAGIKPIQGDVYLIVVPTPFKENHEPDISYIQDATDGIIPILKEKDLYIIESTSPIGTTEKMKDLIFSKRPDLIEKLHIAYCPERVLPGNVIYELVHNDRIVGGINEASTQAAINFYKQFVKGEIHATDSATAEMCKLTENASRDVQIAFANELSLICDKAGINVWELIRLANKHPRVNILQPGCGVGGHCIAVDPYFITTQFPLESKIIGTARELNNYKPLWCVEKIKNEILTFEKEKGKKPKVAICGLAFKPDIDDLRESPALFIAEKIKQIYPSELVFFIEPNIESHPNFVISKLENLIEKIDLAIILVQHKEFKDLKWKKQISFVNS
jgi:UDP-N-acetyl-D-mannosaminuronic acid dehydrogenase